MLFGCGRRVSCIRSICDGDGFGGAVPVDGAAGALRDGADRHEDAACDVLWRNVAVIGAGAVGDGWVADCDTDGIGAVAGGAGLCGLIPGHAVAQRFEDGADRHHDAAVVDDRRLVKTERVAVHEDGDLVVDDGTGDLDDAHGAWCEFVLFVDEDDAVVFDVVVEIIEGVGHDGCLGVVPPVAIGMGVDVVDALVFEIGLGG